MAIALKAGYATNDPRLDRIPRHDPRSLAFPVADVLPSRDLHPRTWPLRWRLDQGQQGACYLFGFTHNRAGSPKPRQVWKDFGTPQQRLARRQEDFEAFAFERYRRAQQLDEWPGEAPEYEGTSGIAAAKAMQEAGLLAEYRWAFGIDDVLASLSHIGPVVFGTVWLAGMFDTRPSGLLVVEGAEEGGHGYDVRGWHADARRVPALRGSGVRGPVLVGTNSWSRSWGRDGNFYLPVEDQPDGSHGAEWLLAKERVGEACVPLDRAAA